MFVPVLAILAALAAMPAMAQPRPPAPPATAGELPPGPRNRIVTVVNADIVTTLEVRSRARLFALNAGFAATPEQLDRLGSQITRLLVDEKLRLQEVQRRQILVSDNDVAEALADIERRNNLPRGALLQQLRLLGIQPRTMIDQIRAQIGWGRLLRQQLGPNAEPSEADVTAFNANLAARARGTEFLVGEIFIPVDDPATEADTRRFVEDVTAQLRRGLPFAVAATQFSQSQTALQGGDLGWQPEARLDPQVASVVTRMPAGAISNPMRVPGGFQIVTLRARREGGAVETAGAPAAGATVLTLRQMFIPFPGRLDPQNPTPEQRAVVERASRISSTTRGCEAFEQAARGVTSPNRPLNPGEVVLESLNPPQLRSLLARQPIGQATQPLIAPDGVAMVMVCSRERRQPSEAPGNAAALPAAQARDAILRDRVEVVSRQLQRELRRRAIIETRA
ncbi:MAG: peptidylprolyl isomerase [Alphaproteobacteria bacterium]|nr:peptidylprolyl isomerase [Alphaproteobacteria bacterium]